MRLVHILRIVLPLALLHVIGCATPVTYGRTGKVLRSEYMRFGMATGTGVAPTTARVTPADGGKTETHRGLAPTGVAPFPAVSLLLAPLGSMHLHASHALNDVCEVGGLIDFTRTGAELRCGTRLGAVDAALSGALAGPRYIRPNQLELRSGVDLSLARGDVVPIVNLYFGYVPWTRSALFESEGAFRSVSVDRAEYRLSMPLGVAFLGGSAPERSIYADTTLSLIPEVTFAHDDLENPFETERQVSLEQTWALFVMLRVDIVTRSPLFPKSG